MSFYIKKNKLYILPLLIFLLALSAGLFGYGRDIIMTYKYSQNWSTGYREIVGWKIASFTIMGGFIGVFIVSLINFLSVRLYISKIINDPKKRIYLYYVVFTSYFNILLTTNALRQGLAASFFLVFIIYLRQQKYAYSLIIACVAILSHSTVIVPICIFLLVHINRFLATCAVIGMCWFVILAEFDPSMYKSSIPTTFDYELISIFIMGITTIFLLLKGNHDRRFFSVLLFTGFLVTIGLKNSQLQRLIFYILPIFTIEVFRCLNKRLIFWLTMLVLPINIIIFIYISGKFV
jgi:hypothetical protein